MVVQWNVVVVGETATEPSRFAHFWQGAESLVPATQNERRALFKTAQLPKVVRDRQFFTLSTSKCASRHSGVQFFISHLTRCLPPDPPLWRAYFSTLRSHKSLEKHCESRLFYLFAHLHLLSSDSFSSLIFSLLLFSSLTLPTCAFSSVHTVRSLTSKLPSNIWKITFYNR